MFCHWATPGFHKQKFNIESNILYNTQWTNLQWGYNLSTILCILQRINSFKLSVFLYRCFSFLSFRDSWLLFFYTSLSLFFKSWCRIYRETCKYGEYLHDWIIWPLCMLIFFLEWADTICLRLIGSELSIIIIHNSIWSLKL